MIFGPCKRILLTLRGGRKISHSFRNIEEHCQSYIFANKKCKWFLLDCGCGDLFMLLFRGWVLSDCHHKAVVQCQGQREGRLQVVR